MAGKTRRSWRPSRSAVYAELHRKHWERIKGIDFPNGAVAIRNDAGKPLIHRPHSRKTLRDMARSAARIHLRKLKAEAS